MDFIKGEYKILVIVLGIIPFIMVGYQVWSEKLDPPVEVAIFYSDDYTSDMDEISDFKRRPDMVSTGNQDMIEEYLITERPTYLVLETRKENVLSITPRSSRYKKVKVEVFRTSSMDELREFFESPTK